MENKDIFIPLTKHYRTNLWSYISDEDVVQGSDGRDYITERALLWYTKVRFELERTIKQIELGSRPEE